MKKVTFSKWEYHIIRIPMMGSVESEVIELNDQGNEGWELVSSIVDNGGVTFHMFKRPK